MGGAARDSRHALLHGPRHGGRLPAVVAVPDPQLPGIIAAPCHDAIPRHGHRVEPAHCHAPHRLQHGMQDA